MKQSKLSARKRLAKPFLFGSLLLGLATVYMNRHWFFQDVEGLRAQEQAKYDAKWLDVMEQRQKQLAEVEEKKKGRS
ncbi:hypothetical protein WMY93_010701 [Mugilogobius chulae]|uniref:Uncharacterized protein n=1 Tax=Mugilogobius chulae TaxID=88201 RepID=A0AAW0P827_9GOBI